MSDLLRLSFWTEEALLLNKQPKITFLSCLPGSVVLRAQTMDSWGALWAVRSLPSSSCKYLSHCVPCWCAPVHRRNLEACVTSAVRLVGAAWPGILCCILGGGGGARVVGWHGGNPDWKLPHLLSSTESLEFFKYVSHPVWNVEIVPSCLPLSQHHCIALPDLGGWLHVVFIFSSFWKSLCGSLTLNSHSWPSMD